MRWLGLICAIGFWSAPADASLIEARFDVTVTALDNPDGEILGFGLGDTAPAFMRWIGTGVTIPPDTGGSPGGEVVTFFEWGIGDFLRSPCPGNCELLFRGGFSPFSETIEYGFPFTLFSPQLSYDTRTGIGRFRTQSKFGLDLSGAASGITVLPIPEPATALLLGIGVLAIARQSRAQRPKN